MGFKVGQRVWATTTTTTTTGVLKAATIIEVPVAPTDFYTVQFDDFDVAFRRAPRVESELMAISQEHQHAGGMNARHEKETKMNRIVISFKEVNSFDPKRTYILPENTVVYSNKYGIWVHLPSGPRLVQSEDARRVWEFFGGIWPDVKTSTTEPPEVSPQEEEQERVRSLTDALQADEPSKTTSGCDQKVPRLSDEVVSRGRVAHVSDLLQEISCFLAQETANSPPGRCAEIRESLHERLDSAEFHKLLGNLQFLTWRLVVD